MPEDRGNFITIRHTRVLPEAFKRLLEINIDRVRSRESGLYRLTSAQGPFIEGRPVFVEVPREPPYDPEQGTYSVECKVWTSIAKYNEQGVRVGEFMCPDWTIATVFEALGIFPRDPRGTGAFPSLPQFGLSEREWEVACLIGQGLTNKEVARELELEESTVKVHVKKILECLQVKNRVQVAIRLHNGTMPLKLIQSA